MVKKLTLFLTMLFCTATIADVIVMQDGRIIENAKILNIGSEKIEYRVGKREVLYLVRKSDVTKITYDNGTEEVFNAPAPAATVPKPESEPTVHTPEPEPEPVAEVAVPDPVAVPEPTPATVTAPEPVHVVIPVPPTAPVSVQDAQGKQTIAVYMAGKEPRGAKGVHNILGGELAKTISASHKYIAVDRTEAIQQQLANEHIFQRSGAVSDDQIKSLGQQLGAQFLCISDINPIGSGSYYLDVRLVDVVTAEIIRTATANSNMRNAEEMRRVARSIAYELIETEKAREQYKRRKKMFLSTAISLDVIGVGLFAYGLVENSNIKKHVDAEVFSEAEKAKTRRDVAYIVGGALVAAGITIHILF